MLFGDFQKKKISIHHSVSRKLSWGNIMEHVSKYFWNTFSPKFLLLHLTNALILDTYNNTSMYFYKETVRTYTYLRILTTHLEQKCAKIGHLRIFLGIHYAPYFFRNRYWTCDLNILTTFILGTWLAKKDTTFWKLLKLSKKWGSRAKASIHLLMHTCLPLMHLRSLTCAKYRVI